MLMKKIEDKDGVSLHAGTGRFNFVKKLAPSRFLYRLNQVPIRISARFSVNRDKIILKFVWKCRGIRIAKRPLEKECEMNQTT